MQTIPFANSLAVVTGIFAIFMFILHLVAPPLFTIVFNSQLFGADIASLFPREAKPTLLIGTLFAVVATSWIFGLVWASLYNRWAK